jgi:hypothetical protein
MANNECQIMENAKKITASVGDYVAVIKYLTGRQAKL